MIAVAVQGSRVTLFLGLHPRLELDMTGDREWCLQGDSLWTSLLVGAMAMRTRVEKGAQDQNPPIFDHYQQVTSTFNPSILIGVGGSNGWI